MRIHAFIRLLPAVAVAIGALSFAAPHSHAVANSHTPSDHKMAVMKTPTCGCCSAWVKLARREGYEVEVTDVQDYVLMKKMASVPGPMQACHTTRIGGYIVEGHVPFAAVAKLMEEKPDITGIAVPGMPMGSPGMGNNPNARFDVIAYGGKAKPGEVFFEAGSGAKRTGWFDRLFRQEAQEVSQ